MSRTIVSVGHRAGQLSAWLAKSASAPANSREPQPVGFDPGSLLPPSTTSELQIYGERLRTGLTQHPAIGQVLDGLFRANGGRSEPLYFEIEAQSAEEVRWECLADPAGGFVALTGACHIGRIAEETSSRETGVRAFAPPLRIAAYLSGLGLRAVDEWNALSAAVRAEHAAGVPIAADIYVGETALLAQVQAECDQAAATGDRSVNVLPMPTDATQLEQQLALKQPHLVHFFCHGTAAMGASFLSLANLADHVRHDGGLASESSIVISVDDMIRWPGLRQTWLVALNCCEGAAPATRLHSMAYRLVSQGGVAAAIGMHEPVATNEASRFSRAMYPPLLGELRKATLAAAGNLVTIELASAMAPARRALRDLYPGTKANGRWTLPVLYTQDRLFEVYCVPSPPPGAGVAAGPVTLQQMLDISDRVRTVAGWLRAMPPEAPGELRERALSLLDLPPVVPAQMRPDRMGQFIQGVQAGPAQIEHAW
jgi:hypothetical protein